MQVNIFLKYIIRFLLIPFAFLFIFPSLIFSQDPHFTQIGNAPMYVNPGMLAMKSDLQVIANFRSQWIYQTINVSGIYPFLKKDSTQRRWGGVGASLFNDQAGTGGILQTNGVMAGFAYNLDLKNETYLSGGVQLGFFQKKITDHKLTSGNQFDNGVYNPSGDLGIDVKSDGVGLIDAGAGILFYKNQEDKMRFYAGISLFHLTQPNESFTNEKSPLPMKISFTGGVKAFNIIKNVEVIPSLLYTNQSAAQEINIGSHVKYNFEAASGLIKDGYLAFAGWYRLNDAFNLGLEMGLSNYTIGFSYDMNVSGNSLYNKGAFEIALIYHKPMAKKVKKPETPKEEDIKPEDVIVTITAKVVDADSGYALTADIVLKNKKTDELVQTAKDSVLQKILEVGSSYELIVNKIGYLESRQDIRISAKLRENKDIKKKIILSKIYIPPPPKPKEVKKSIVPLPKSGEQPPSAPIAKPVEPKRVKLDLGNALFQTGQFAIAKDSRKNMNKLVNFLVENPKVKMEVAGHTDSTGTDIINDQLSFQRAQTIVNYLITNGISVERLVAKGYGSRKPIAPNDTPRGRSQNRRVEFIILER